jgi:hypothetical protein
VEHTPTNVSDGFTFERTQSSIKGSNSCPIVEDYAEKTRVHAVKGTNLHDHFLGDLQRAPRMLAMNEPLELTNNQ